MPSKLQFLPETKSLCSRFSLTGHEFSRLELEDKSETVYLSDNADYVVTEAENAWILHHVSDTEPIMFGLTANKNFNLACPDLVSWYWASTMERVKATPENDSTSKECHVELWMQKIRWVSLVVGRRT